MGCLGLPHTAFGSHLLAQQPKEPSCCLPQLSGVWEREMGLVSVLSPLAFREWLCSSAPRRLELRGCLQRLVSAEIGPRTAASLRWAPALLRAWPHNDVLWAGAGAEGQGEGLGLEGQILLCCQCCSIPSLGRYCPCPRRGGQQRMGLEQGACVFPDVSCVPSSPWGWALCLFA